MRSNIYINNLTPNDLNVSARFWDLTPKLKDPTQPAFPLPSGTLWGMKQAALGPFDLERHEVGWLARATGIHNDHTYLLQVDVSDGAQQPIVSAVVNVKGTVTSSDITIGASNAFFSDSGHADNGRHRDVWTDGGGRQWQIDFLFSNGGGYADVVYNLALLSSQAGA